MYQRISSKWPIQNDHESIQSTGEVSREVQREAGGYKGHRWVQTMHMRGE